MFKLFLLDSLGLIPTLVRWRAMREAKGVQLVAIRVSEVRSKEAARVWSLAGRTFVGPTATKGLCVYCCDCSWSGSIEANHRTISRLGLESIVRRKNIEFGSSTWEPPADEVWLTATAVRAKHPENGVEECSGPREVVRTKGGVADHTGRAVFR